MPFFYYEKDLTAYLGVAIATSDIIGTTQWGSIAGTLSAQTDLQLELNAKQNLIAEDAGIFYINERTGLDTPVDPSIAETYKDIEDAIASSPYSTTGAIIKIQGGCDVTFSPVGIFEPIGASPNGGPLEIVGDSASLCILRSLRLTSVSGKLIIRDCTIIDFESINGANVEFRNCIVEGTLQANSANQRILFYDTYYKDLLYLLVGNTPFTQVFIDLDSSSREYRPTISPGLVNTITGDKKHAINRYEDAHSEVDITDFLPGIEVNTDCYYYITSIPTGIFSGHANELVRANIPFPVLESDWSYTPMINNSYVYLSWTDSIVYRDSTGTFSYINDFPVSVSSTANIIPTNFKEIHLDTINGDDTIEAGYRGTSTNPLKTFAEAYKLVSSQGTIILATGTDINLQPCSSGNTILKELTIKGSGKLGAKVRNIHNNSPLTLSNLTAEDATCNSDVTFDNCRLSGVLAGKANNQRIFLKNTDYTGLEYAFTRNQSTDFLTLDVGTSSTGLNPVVTSGIANYSIGETIHVVTVYREIKSVSVTDPSTLGSIKAGDRYWIAPFSTAGGVWTGHDKEIGEAIIDDAALESDWQYTTMSPSSYVYSDAQSGWYSMNPLNVPEFIANFPFIVDGKLADNVGEGLMSIGDRLKVFFVHSSFNASDQNIDIARNSIGKGGNLIPVAGEDVYYADYFNQRTSGYNKFHIAVSDGVTPQGDEELKNMVIYLPHLRNINATNVATQRPMSEVLSGYATDSHDMSAYFNKDTWHIINSSSNSLYTIIVKSLDPEAQFVINVDGGDNIIASSLEILQGSGAILEWSSRDKLFVQK